MDDYAAELEIEREDMEREQMVTDDEVAEEPNQDNADPIEEYSEDEEDRECGGYDCEERVPAFGQPLCAHCEQFMFAPVAPDRECSGEDCVERVAEHAQLCSSCSHYGWMGVLTRG